MEEIKELHRTSDTIVQQNPVPMLMTDARIRCYRSQRGVSRDERARPRSRHGNEPAGDQGPRTERGGCQGGDRREAPGVWGSHGRTPDRDPHPRPVRRTHSRQQKRDRSTCSSCTTKLPNSGRASRRWQKKMEEIADLKQRSDIIVKQNPMPIMLMDASFKIVMVNDAYIIAYRSLEGSAPRYERKGFQDHRAERRRPQDGYQGQETEFWRNHDRVPDRSPHPRPVRYPHARCKRKPLNNPLRL